MKLNYAHHRPWFLLGLAVVLGLAGWTLSLPSARPLAEPPVAAQKAAGQANPEVVAARAAPAPAVSPQVAQTALAPEPQPVPPARALPAPHALPAPGTVPARLNFASGWKQESRPALGDFSAWSDRWLGAPAAERAALVAEGVALAGARRAELKAMIRNDPQAAIAAAVPLAVRAQLPEEVSALLEQRVSGEGRLAQLGVLGVPGEHVAVPIYKEATVNGETFRAYTYGRRETQATKVGISVLGVALDGTLAVSESPLRVLEPGEVPAAGQPVVAVCPVSGDRTPVAERSPLNTDGLRAVEAGGKVYVLCHVEHAEVFEARLRTAEDAAEPDEGALQAAFTQENGQAGTSGVSGRPSLAWSTGAKKVLIIRVDFSDKTGTPVNPADSQQITPTYATNVFGVTNGISDFYAQASYGATSLTLLSSDVTPVYRMPQTATYYAQGDGTNAYNATLHSNAESAAVAGGFTLANYDRIGVVFSNLSGITNSKITYAGLGALAGNQFWINGYFDFRACAHEIGHNYGLQHCNLWQVSDGNPVSAAGYSAEYNDPFGVMSSGTTDIKYHFDMWEKSLLHWIPDTSVTPVSAAGTYRVYRFDHASANTANQLALKIVRNSTQDYWIGLRQLFTSNTSLMNGAYILWGYNSVVQGNLLDMTTPGSSAQDAALAVGASFHDTVAGITINPIAKGGTTPNEYLDVSISFDPRLEWQVSTVTADQQLGTATLTLTRSGSSVGAVSVNFATADGTALAGTHYTAQSGTVNWANGDGAPKTVTVPLSTNAVFNGLKTFTVTLSAPTGGAVIVNSATATVNIASPGTGDPGFHADRVNSTLQKVLVQTDGKLLIGGWFSQLQDSASIYSRSGIARLNADGRIDTAYANSGAGVNTTPVRAMALQPDGKLLIAGDFTAVNGTTRNRVARLNADGTLDTTFDPGTGSAASVRALAWQPDGKIIVGGDFTAFAGVAREYVARLNPDGSLDTGFVGPDFIGTSGWRVHALALQPDGKILAAGYFYLSASLPRRAGLVRMSASGTFDSSFNVGHGAHAAGNTASLQTVNAIAVQRDGSIVVGGAFTAFNNVTHNYLARVDGTGALDATFNPSSDAAVNSLLVQADGKILAGGSFATMNSTAQSRFARLKADGTLDTAFNVGTGSTGDINDVQMQPDGREMIAGDFATIQGVASITVGRLFAGPPGLPGTVQFSSSTYAGTEGNDVAITATRTGGSYGAVSMNYGTQPGTAAATRYTPASGTLSWADGDAASKSFTLSLVNDNIAQPNQTLTLNLGIAIGGAILATPGTASVSISMAYAAWKNSKFTAAELLDPTISGDLADPDRDGLLNIFEYAYGFEPKIRNFTNLPSTAMQNIGGSNYLTLTFRRSPTAGDLIYTPQSGAPLGTWNGLPVQVGSPVINADGTETVTFRDSVPFDPATTPLRFMRLQVIASP